MMPAEVILEVPWDIIDNGKGIAVDIGGSVIKLLYLHKDDWVEPSKRPKDTKGKLHLVNYAREQMDEGFANVKKVVHIIRDSPDETVNIFSTGVGGSQFQDRIQSEFKVKSTSVIESDCFAHSFYYLMKNLKRKDFLFDACQPAFEEAAKAAEEQVRMVEKLKQVTAGIKHVKLEKISITPPVQDPANQCKPLCEESGMYPVNLFFCGSGFGAMKLEEDETFTAVDGSGRGGRACLALGCLLTEAKTFDEFLALCERGDATKLGSPIMNYTERMLKEGSELGPNEAASYFGKASGKTTADFKKEDLARHLLEMFVNDLAQLAYNTHVFTKTKTIFFAGGFVNNALVRQLLTKEWLLKNISMAAFAPFHTDIAPLHFMKPGTHMGALGAYLNSTLHFLSESGKIVTESTGESTGVKE